MYMPPSRFHQPHPSKRNKKLGQTYCPKSRRCRATKHGLTPGSSSTANCACAQAQMQALAETPLESHSLVKGRNETKRYDTIRRDTTSLVHIHPAQHSVPFSRLPTSAIHHLTSGTLASRKPDCVCCQHLTYMCAVALLFLHRKLQSGVVSSAPMVDGGWASMRWQTPGGHVRAGWRMRQIRWFMLGCIITCTYACVHAGGWLGDGRLARSVGRFDEVPSNSCAVSSCGDLIAV